MGTCLTGKVAIVTGSCEGIGRTIAFARDGAVVYADQPCPEISKHEMNDRQELGRVGFQPIVAFDGDGRLVAAVLRPVRRPDGRQIVTPLRRPIAPIRSIGRGLRSCCVATATIAHRKRYASVGNLGDIRLPALRQSGYQVQHLQLYPCVPRRECVGAIAA